MKCVKKIISGIKEFFDREEPKERSGIDFEKMREDYYRSVDEMAIEDIKYEVQRHNKRWQDAGIKMPTIVEIHKFG